MKQSFDLKKTVHLKCQIHDRGFLEDIDNSTSSNYVDITVGNYEKYTERMKEVRDKVKHIFPAYGVGIGLDCIRVLFTDRYPTEEEKEKHKEVDGVKISLEYVGEVKTYE